MLLVKYSEIILKGRNTRLQMERRLVSNMRMALGGLGNEAKFSHEGGMFSLVLPEGSDEAAAAHVLARVFGVYSVHIGKEIEASVPAICGESVRAARSFPKGSSFAISAKRIGETGPRSKEIAIAAGKAVQDATGLRVNLDEPDNTIFVSVRGERALVFGNRIPGYGGLPLGSGGKLASLIGFGSSPLAAWEAMKRGSQIELVAAYKDEEEKENVETQAAKLEKWHIGKKLGIHFVEAANSEEAFQKLGEIAGEKKAEGMLMGMHAIESALEFKDCLFPLIGMDKKEVAEKEKELGLG